MGMTDKYEQFKDWFKHHPTDEDEIDLVFAIGNLFKEFEEEESKKEKEKEIKDTIEQALEENNCCFAGRDTYANAIYKKLEEKDLIK